MEWKYGSSAGVWAYLRWQIGDSPHWGYGRRGSMLVRKAGGLLEINERIRIHCDVIVA